jgi:hypothetical protein
MNKHIFLDYVTQYNDQLYFLSKNQMIQMYLANMHDPCEEQI